MNKKLLTLAVGAALAAPAIASAEAILYGKLNVSLDYANVTNAIAPVFNGPFGTTIGTNAGSIVPPNFYSPPAGTVVPQNISVLNGVRVPTGTLGAIVVAPGGNGGGVDFKGWGLAKGNAYIPGQGRASRLGVKGSEDLGNGLKAVYQIEIQINFDTNNNLTSGADTFQYRNTFVGLAGDWGTFLLGRHDTPLKISTGRLDLFADSIADMNGTVGFQDIRLDNTVAYISPSWGGFQLALATSPSGGATALGNTNVNSDAINGAYSLAGIYKNGPFYASAAYEVISNEWANTETASLLNTAAGSFDITRRYLPATGYVDDDMTKWRLGLGLLDWNGFTLTGIYEQQDHLAGGQKVNRLFAANPVTTATFSTLAFNLPGGPEKQDLWQVQAGYAFGQSMVKAMYGQASYDTSYSYTGYGGAGAAGTRAYADNFYNGGRDAWAVGYDYNFSKRTTAYILYTAVTNDQKDLSAADAAVINSLAGGWTGSVLSQEWDAFSIGMSHSF